MSPEPPRFLDETSRRYLEKPFTISEVQTPVRGVLQELFPLDPPSGPGQR